MSGKIECIKTTEMRQDVSAAWKEADENGDPFTPRVPAVMKLSLPYPMNKWDIIALWQNFSDQLRDALGYSDQMEKEPNPFARFLPPKQGE